MLRDGMFRAEAETKGAQAQAEALSARTHTGPHRVPPPAISPSPFGHNHVASPSRFLQTPSLSSTSFSPSTALPRITMSKASQPELKKVRAMAAFSRVLAADAFELPG